MPKRGFKTITFSDTVYKQLYSVYEEYKDFFELKGINSFSGFIISQLQDTLDGRPITPLENQK